MADTGVTPVGIDNNGQIVVKNRAWRRQRRNTAQLNGLPKNYYTKKRTHKRKKNGKTIKICKK